MVRQVETNSDPLEGISGISLVLMRLLLLIKSRMKFGHGKNRDHDDLRF